MQAMIIYDIGCEHGHRFEGWFGTVDDYDSQLDQGLLSCPVCGSLQVRRVPTASHISTRSSAATGLEPPAADSGSGSATAEYIEQLKAFIEKNYDDVGDRFSEEARKVYYGETEARNLRGVAGPQEVHDLMEEGISVIPLPAAIRNTRKLN